MPTATESSSPIPGLLEWSAPCPKAKVTLTSHAFAHDGKVILVDPIAASTTVRTALARLGQPVLIILTNGNHERAAAAWKKEYNIPCAFSALATREISFKPDVVLETSPVLHGVRPVALPGAATGEHALLVPDLKLVVFGDALIHLPETGLSRLPDKYCTDPKSLDNSLQNVSGLAFDHAAFAHGPALVGGARERIRRLLEKP